MAFKGTLLKPSERNGTGKRTAARTTSRYEVLKDKIRDWWHDRLKIGEALREIRDGKLYKDDHATFENFCVAEFDLKHSQAYALIAAVGVRESIKTSAIADKITNEGQARALAPVPVEKREDVIVETAKTGPVTARRITEIAAKVTTPAVDPEKIAHFDKTGYPIPDSVWPDWERAVAYNSVLTEISKIKVGLEKGLQDRDVIFREVTNSTVSTLKNAYGDLKCVIPYAVCPTCQGFEKDKCTLCKSRGFLSQFRWDSCVPKKTREIREAAVRQ